MIAIWIRATVDWADEQAFLAQAPPEDAVEPGTDGCYWTSRWIEVPIHAGHRVYLLRRRLLPWTPPKWVLTTNNYAMVKTAATEPLASGWLRAGGRLTPLDRSLSLANRTLASRTTLRHDLPSPSRAGLLSKYRRHRTPYDRAPPPDLAWSAPYVAAMAQLMHELDVR